MTSEKYIEGLLKELVGAKERKQKGIYRINDRISDATANAVQRYFYSRQSEYMLELKKCKKCKGTWDVLIFIIGA